MPNIRTVSRSLTILGGAAATLVLIAGTALADPPGIPSEASARSQLAGLTVAADGPLTGYDRDLFPTGETKATAATPARSC